MKGFIKKWPKLSLLLVILAVIGTALFGWVRYRMHGPYREYLVSKSGISVADLAEAREIPLLAGVGMRDITPDLDRYDSWVDVDENSKFEPDKGDTWVDRNGNEDFDFVWLGGFGANRPAQGINDPLSVRAIALKHQDLTLVLVTLDLVGLTHERFIKVRTELADQGIDHIVFSTTHTHNSPDTMGIWSYNRLLPRFDQGYLDEVLAKTKEAITESVANLEKVSGRYVSRDLDPSKFVRDSRKPLVYDRQLCALQFLKENGQTVATLVSWGNHPEGFGSRNPLVSSDFVHYWREGVEKGLPEPNGISGFGGMCLYFQGPVGGLMTPLGLDVPDRDGTRIHKKNGLGKVRALGENLAIETLRALQSNDVQKLNDPRLSYVAQSVFIPIEGTYRIPIMLGMIHPGWYGGKAKTEVDALRVGEVEILTIPGEIFPEIVEGKVEAPEGRDFEEVPILEKTGLRAQMKGRMQMVFNLANDEIGYIIPKSQWDVKEPYAYGLEEAAYGEINSGGSNVSATIYSTSGQVLDRLHAFYQAAN